MNNDGWGLFGAGSSDMRLAGSDLQHHRQSSIAKKKPIGEQRKVRQSAGTGGPMKEAIDVEMARHNESRAMRLKHLEDHYKR